MSDLVRPLEVGDREVGPRAVVEIARNALDHARRGEHPAQRDDGILHPRVAAEGSRDLRLGEAEIRREVRGADAPVAAGHLRHAGFERSRKRHARARKLREEDRARPVGDEVAVDLFRRMRRPPAHDADLPARCRRQIPGSRRAARASGDGDLPPRIRIDLLEVEDAMDIGRDARRRRRPEHRRDQGIVAREARGVALGREPLPVRHPSFGREPVEQLEVEPVEAEPDDRRARRWRARLTRGDIGRLDRREGSGGNPRGCRPRDRRDGRFCLAPAAPERRQKEQKERSGARKSHPRHHSRRFDPTPPGRYTARPTVGVAQLVRAPDCGSGCRGFKSLHSPQSFLASFFAPVAQSG